MNLLMWNVRGLGKGEKCLTVKNLIRANKINFMGLIETKHRHTIRSRAKTMWGSDDFAFCESIASETCAGGIATIWDSSKFAVSNSHIGARWILLEGQMIEKNFDCCIAVVYGPNDRVERHTFFMDLKTIIQSISKPVIIIGDFNVILYTSERVDSFYCSLSMQDFSNWIQDLGLIDIPLHRIKFTRRRNESKSKLDKAFCCNNWLRAFPNMRLEGLNRSISDHNPLILFSDVIIN